MERLPYIDEHSRVINADRERTWAALLHATCKNPDDLTTVPSGFVLDEADPLNRFAIKGQHWFSRYALTYRLDEIDPGHTRVTAESRAVFPGIHGRVYRALVIDSGMHQLIVRRMLLRGIAVAAGEPGLRLPGQRWGATDAEVAMELPCDRELSGDVVVCDRAVPVSAPAGAVFAWLCQLRVAPYSYDLLDNFGRHSPRERDPLLMDLAVGQRFMGLFDLVDYTPGVQVTLSAKGVAVTYAVHPETRTRCRLHARVRFRGPTWLLALPVFGDWVMMRKQLLTLKTLAEREALALG